MVFIDLSKAFDTVAMSTLWTLLRRYGCPETFVKIIQEFHDGMVEAVSIGGSTTDPFHSLSGSTYRLQCPSILVQEFSSALDPMEKYSNWLD